MSESFESAIKKNLFWIIGFVVCIFLAIGIGLNTQFAKDNDPEKGFKSAVVNANVESKYFKKLTNPPPPPKTEEEKTQEIIEDYDTVIVDENVPIDERVRYLYAKGSLQLTGLGDIDSAIEIFQQIILEYPDHYRAGRSYFRLFDCYKKLNDEENMRWVCNRVMEVYPAGTPEHKWAQTQMGMFVTE